MRYLTINALAVHPNVERVLLENASEGRVANGERPSLQDLGLVLAELLVGLSVHFERVLVVEAARRLDRDHAAMFADGEDLLTD